MLRFDSVSKLFKLLDIDMNIFSLLISKYIIRIIMVMINCKLLDNITSSH